eukprot:TRINITY_DN1463_c0_g1_i1.p1 TRINITY_DN1463_c0_g1~~TRINITY_DN1463_c0_g1_i1.p1  ORF type:complete len:271 (-),score=32.69 TRINITY_DN1463_c0_g1_i1:993-1805(-)
MKALEFGKNKNCTISLDLGGQIHFSLTWVRIIVGPHWKPVTKSLPQMRIQFNKPEYHPGHDVYGLVRLCLPNSVSVTQGVKITLVILEHVQWSESVGNTLVTFTGEHVHSTQSQTLYVPKSDDHVLQPGIHVWPFIFRLPEGLPPTVSTSLGMISYDLRCAVDKGTKYKSSSELKVTVPVENKPPVDSSSIDEKTDVKLSAIPSQCIYYTDDPKIMRLDLDVQNPTKFKVRLDKISFKMRRRFHARTSTKTIKATLYTSRLGMIIEPRSK